MSERDEASGPSAGVHQHPGVVRFREELDRRLDALGPDTLDAAQDRVRVLPASVHTAALAAEALGCEVGAIANSLLFAVPGTDGEEPTPVLVLTSGEHRVDTAAVAARLGVGGLRRATPDFVRSHTGQVIGGVSPFAHPAPVPTYVDPWLARHPVVWAAAGHPAAVFRTTYDELRALTGASEVDVTLSDADAAAGGQPAPTSPPSASDASTGSGSGPSPR